MDTTPTREAATSRRKPGALYYLGVGLGIWLLATIAFRVAGQYFFVPSSWQIIATFIVAGVSIPLIVLVLLNQNRLNQVERLKAVILLAVPGMLADVVTTAFFSTVFPNMAADAAGLFGGLLLLNYAEVLLVGLLPTNNK